MISMGVLSTPLSIPKCWDIQSLSKKVFVGPKSDTIPWSSKGESVGYLVFDDSIDGINVMSIEASPKEYTSMWKTSFLRVDWPYRG
jgi:hypothetical protein